MSEEYNNKVWTNIMALANSLYNLAITNEDTDMSDNFRKVLASLPATACADLGKILAEKQTDDLVATAFLPDGSLWADCDLDDTTPTSEKIEVVKASKKNYPKYIDNAMNVIRYWENHMRTKKSYIAPVVSSENDIENVYQMVNGYERIIIRKARRFLTKVCTSMQIENLLQDLPEVTEKLSNEKLQKMRSVGGNVLAAVRQLNKDMLSHVNSLAESKGLTGMDTLPDDKNSIKTALNTFEFLKSNYLAMR